MDTNQQFGITPSSPGTKIVPWIIGGIIVVLVGIGIGLGYRQCIPPFSMLRSSFCNLRKATQRASEAHDILQNRNSAVATNTAANLAPESDPDGDRLTTAQEAQYGTNPQLPDTDGDGRNDYAEVTMDHTNPLLVDTDGDGKGDLEERVSGGNPLDPRH